jgi:hypothetical protein
MFLPMAGERNSEGQMSGAGTEGAYGSDSNVVHSYSLPGSGNPHWRDDYGSVRMWFNGSNIYMRGGSNPNVGIGRPYNTAMPIRCVERRLPLPRTGILAPPGVLGVGATTGKLTLKGSKEYSADVRVGSTDFGVAKEFGGLADETVYVAYFKWGSLIAIGDDGTPDGQVDFKDIMWAPESYDIEALKNNMMQGTPYGHIPYARRGASPYDLEFPANFPPNIASGLGDPCELAEGGANYMTPDKEFVFGYLDKWDVTLTGEGSTEGYGHRATASEYTTFLPVAGAILAGGEISMEAINDRGPLVAYSSRTPDLESNPGVEQYVYGLYIGINDGARVDSNIFWNNRQFANTSAIPIRCVRQVLAR